MIHFRTIRRKMIALVALPTLVIYLAILGLTLVYLQEQSRQEVEHDVTILAANYAARFDSYLREAANVAEATARFIETAPDLTEKQIYDLLRANVSQNPLVYGSCMAFEPGTFKQDDSLFAPYVHRNKNGLVQMNINEDVYNWYRDPQYTWFRASKEAGQSLWSKPYFDEGAGNVLMVTYSAPFQRDGIFRGVTTIDVDLPQLKTNVGQAIVAGLPFVILTYRGQFVYAPDESRIMRQTVFDAVKEANRSDLKELGRQLTSGNTGVMVVDGWHIPEKQWVFYAPIKSTGWTFACWVPEKEVLSDVRKRLALGGIALSVTLVMIVVSILIVSGLITNPIALLKAKVLEIAAGNLDARVEGISSRDEIGELAHSFNQMTADLRSHVDEVAREHAARAKIEHDLDIAQSIQQGLLPKHPPQIASFEIAGWSQPADQTGGDYYDWQELPDGKIVISLADVTGHGIGPALVTAVCRAYSRASFPSGQNLEIVMDRINKLLVEDLPADRFVTFVAGLLDTQTSCMQLLSAGHGPIFVYRGQTNCIEDYGAQGIPFGLDDHFDYGIPQEIQFATGDMLVLFTDGFFEWANPDGKLFGIESLKEVIRSASHLSPSGIIAQMHSAVLEFAKGTPQQDDLTAVIVKRIAKITNAV